ncbi:MAG TPA: 1-deoxy-D-xylulose-5-phosphate synthase [Thermoanaerobaculia bacterium]|nr:1-deoxy-D-xylulose-5-phosphate synthase [Thermoanaerobaculia bacterium]
MSRMLDSIRSPLDLRKLPEEELPKVAAEIREFMLDRLSKTGGHLASGLGAVELTIALHYVFDTPVDRIVWDVGHQTYPHKILTGRRERFATLRQKGGISGFTSREESEYDAFNAAHASTAISAALGMAVARDLKKEDFHVIAVVGDGGLTGGMAMEGLNQAGYLNRKLLVILNDNEMSISANVGAMSGYLNRIVSGQIYNRVRDEAGKVLEKIPLVGDRLLHVAREVKDAAKKALVPGTLFEDLGFRYVGPVHGHSIPALVSALRAVKDADHPVLLHVRTLKGKGYAIAESDPVKWHGASPFAVATGESPKKEAAAPPPPSYTSVFGRTLVELAEKDPRIVAITAAMPEGTGLDKFAKRFPERFFDVGICEQHGITFAAGLATQGMKPVAAIYSTFLQRAYDQMFHDVCLMDLPVVFCLDRAGLVGADGPTHHGAFDLTYLRVFPNMHVAAPKDEDELRHLLATAFTIGHPVAVRYPRGEGEGAAMEGPPRVLPVGKAEVLRRGKSGAIWAAGNRVMPALRAAERLAEEGIDLTIVNARWVKPLDREAIAETILPGSKLVTVEDHAIAGGFGSAVAEALGQMKIEDVEIVSLGIPDRFIAHATQKEQWREVGIDEEGIVSAAKDVFGAKVARPVAVPRKR